MLKLAPRVRSMFFFFQAEDGIRDLIVTGVQTCALPIWPKRAGVIGLGAGTLAAYGQPGDIFRFYEINPLVVPIAQTSFTYLRETPAKVDIVLGDARLSLENDPPQQFDVLAVDAFSGDAIPVHLLTREPVALYLRHLKPAGILAIHTSNTYLRLAPIVQLLARDAGCSARLIAMTTMKTISSIL